MQQNNISQAGKSADALVHFQTNRPHRILVVDDDPLICHLNAEALIQHGYDVNAAEDGEAGWEALNADSYDLLITDNKMPKLTGVELLMKLHAVRMALPVIMATGALPTLEFARYPWLRPTATLLKPYTVAEFLGTVRIVLHVTDIARERTSPPQYWHRQPAIGRLQS